jgi:nucleoside-diphosphate-sugar epimerase
MTGATGFVGGRLADALRRDGVRVDAIVRAAPRGPTGYRAHRHDGTMRSMAAIVEKARPDTVFHLAALASGEHAEADVDPLLDANIVLGTHLADACSRRGGAAFVNAGSHWQHGLGTAAYAPVSLYAAMKQAFQDLLAFYASMPGMRVITLKFCDVYGPADPRGKLLALLDGARAGGEPLKLSPGRQLVDMIYVDDAVAALLRAARDLSRRRSLSGTSWSVTSGRNMPLREVVSLYARAAGPIEVVWGGRPYRPREVMRPWHGSPLPGWKPRVSLREGLELCAASARRP